MGHPELNAYALIWRIKTGLAAEDELDAGGDPELLIRTLSTLLALWGPEVMPAWLDTVAGASDPCGAVEETWRVRLPGTEAVLATLGSFHPRKDVAKAARRSLFRSGPAAARRVDPVRRGQAVGGAVWDPQAFRS